MVRDFQTVIGNETRAQMLEREERLPDLVVACVGGGSNAIGMFHPFLDDADVEIHGVEAAGEGVETPRHAATLSKGTPGVLHGARSYLLQDARRPDAGSPFDFGGPRLSRRRPGTFLAEGYRPGEIFLRHRPGGAGRLHAAVQAGRHHSGAGIGACHRPCRCASRRRWRKDKIIAVCLSGRGDKDVFTVAARAGRRRYEPHRGRASPN